MAFIDFVKGDRSKYSQETYPNSVFFAPDTHELLFQGISYGWPTTMKAVKSVEINSTGLMTITYVNGGSDTIQLTKTMVGLSNVDNTADIDKPVSTAVSELVTNTKNTIDNYTVNGKKISTNPVLAKGDVGLGNVDNIKQIPAVEKGAANGVVPLNADGKIDSVYFDGQQSPVKGVDGTYTTSTLPASPTTGMFIYTSDDKKFREYNGLSWEVVEPKQDTLYNFRKNPPTGDSSRVSILYRWDGEDLAEVSSTVALGEVTGTAYDGGKGKANRDAIVSLPGSLVSSIARGTVNGNSIIINVNVVTKSGLNYGSPAAANLTFTAATSSVAGLMSSTDKSRLDTLYIQISKTGKFSFLDGTVTPSGTTVVIKNQVVNTASGEPINTPITLSAATTTLAGVMSAADKEKLNGIAEGANKYVLPVATSSALGGIMIGFTEGGAGNRNYAVKLNNNRAYVNVPWTDQNVQQHPLGSSTGIFYLLAGFTPNSIETETNGVYKVPDFYYSPNTDTLHGRYFEGTYFEGKLKGNADTATKATQDANGNNIVNTYATKKEIGTNTYTGANYVSKETNLTDAILQLDEEIKATNDNLDLEHTNAEATYAKKTELGKKLDISTYTSDKATFALKSEIPNVSNFLTISNAQSTYLTKTDASNTYQLKGSYLTSVSIATISDLNANWDTLLKSAPSGYVTRWPSISEVTGKQNLTIYKGDSTVNNYNGTGGFTLKVPGYYNFPFYTEGYGKEDYFKLFTIRLTKSYINHRICFDITGRSGGVDHVYLSFDNASVISAYKVITFGYIGVGVYGPKLSIRKVSGTSTESVFEIYLAATQSYDECTVFNFIGIYEGFKIEIGGPVTSLPSGTTACVGLNVFRGIAKATTTSIGGIKVGNGLEIESDGTLNCTVQPGSGTVSWGNVSGKPSVFSTNIASISDLHANWDSLLKATPASYVTRWPSISEVTGKQNLVIKLNGGSTEGTNMFTFNGTGAKSVNITASKIGAAASSHSHTKSQITDFPTTWAWGNISGKPSFATVATSGSYNDLTNKPSIPSLSGYATQSWVNSQGFLRSVPAADKLQILEVRSGSNLAYVELKSEEHSIKFRKDSYSITYDNETVFDFRTSFNQITNTVYTSLYPSLTYNRSSGVDSNPFLSSKLGQRACVPLNTILGNINYRIIAEPETISGLYLLSLSLYSGLQPTSACEIYSCLFTNITGEDLCRLEKAYPGIMNAMGTGNRFSLRGRNCKSLGKGYFMLDE